MKGSSLTTPSSSIYDARPIRRGVHTLPARPVADLHPEHLLHGTSDFPEQKQVQHSAESVAFVVDGPGLVEGLPEMRRGRDHLVMLDPVQGKRIALRDWRAGDADAMHP